MKRIRLKKDSYCADMSTPYGLIGHDWVEVHDDTYVYSEMEVEGQEEPVAPVEVEPVVVKEPVEELVEEPEPKPKKKRRKRK